MKFYIKDLKAMLSQTLNLSLACPTVVNKAQLESELLHSSNISPVTIYSHPQVSYVKVVDLFMVFSLTEILVITIESIVICKLFEWETEKEEREAKQEEERANDGGKEVVSYWWRPLKTGCSPSRELERGGNEA